MEFKNKKQIASKLLKKIMDNSLTFDANNTTCLIIHQPKVPENLKKFCKINKEWLLIYQEELSID